MEQQATAASHDKVREVLDRERVWDTGPACWFDRISLNQCQMPKKGNSPTTPGPYFGSQVVQSDTCDREALGGAEPQERLRGQARQLQRVRDPPAPEGGAGAAEQEARGEDLQAEIHS